VAVFLQKQANDYLALADNILVLAETSYRQANTLNLWGDNYQQFDLNADYVTFWQAKKRDAEGRLSHSVTGSGLSTTRNYDPATGQLLDIQTGFFYSQKIRDLEYRYDLLNNLSYRADLIQDVREDFAYDALDRLTYASTTSTLMGSIEYNRTLNYQYDTLGNIIDKTGVGSMQYGAGGAGPHAVTYVNNGAQFSYDANGNMLTGNGRTIRYNGADQAYQLSKGSSTVNFSYAADRSRYLKTSAATKTLYLDKIYERVTDLASGEISHKNMIYADGKLVATNVETVTGAGNVKAATTRYMHYDPLGSIEMITGPRGEVVDRLSYDPFGARRPGDWKADGIVTLEAFSNRGFTGHEHIDEIGLIHMNGRVYDAELGRFLSADRYIQAPYNTQSFNRYSYVWNNPLKYTDPSGWLAAFKEERAIRKENYDKTGSAYDESWRDSNNDNYDRGAVQLSNIRRGLKGLGSYYENGKYGSAIKSSTQKLVTTYAEQFMDPTSPPIVKKKGNTVYIFEGLSLEVMCKGSRACEKSIKSPLNNSLQDMGNGLYVDTTTKTYKKYTDSLAVDIADNVDNMATIGTVLMPALIVVTGPVKATADVAKIYYSEDMTDAVIDVSVGIIGGKTAINGISTITKLTNPNAVRVEEVGSKLTGAVYDKLD
jgi:RHS repeat-associated protein